MFGTKDTILLVDDQEINRKILCKQIGASNKVLEAANGRDALEQIQNNESIGVIVLDLAMPVMDGFEFLDTLKAIGQTSIPVIVMTASDDADTEVKALRAGALDFVKKPVNREILISRIENALIRNQMVMLQRMEYLATHDTLTNLYNRNKMFAETRRILDANPDQTFVFVRFDIDKFRLYNSAMGEEEGNHLLCFIADSLRELAKDKVKCSYGRMDADVFCLCELYDEDMLEHQIEVAQGILADYRKDYSLESSFGIYIIDDNTLGLETIYTRASLAASKCKNIYEQHFAYYDTSMSEQIVEEQSVTNQMKKALEAEEFEVYLQPKYDLNTDMPCGAEALVRWRHPEKGLIPPGKFIPVFEKNGFIATLDYYMWEHVCRLIASWIQNGMRIFPISVNMSRVSLFNPYVAELIIGLVAKYKVPPELLNLEVTESAYMSNSELMGVTLAKLQSEGFVILMDDFGSGYSSLNTLKEINIDILKLDMKFMPNGKDNGKSEKILSSMVRMAGWLGMDVIAEGVETLEQKQFLESIGCGYVQGYYYAKPMPVSDYEQLVKKMAPIIITQREHVETLSESEAVWSSDPHIGEILSSIDTPVAIFEYSAGSTEVLRINRSYIERYGNDARKKLFGNISKDDELSVESAFQETSNSGKESVCEFSYITPNGEATWVRMKIRRIAYISKSAILCCMFGDITTEKLYENRLTTLIRSFESLSKKEKLLVVDDSEVSRSILRNMFEDSYEILEAEDGEEGLHLLQENAEDTAAILLDIVMPRMDGETFLRKKNAIAAYNDIPVVVISAESDSAVQLGMLKNGVSDYIVKPYNLDITKQRVENSMAYQSRFRRLVEEYHIASEQKEE